MEDARESMLEREGVLHGVMVVSDERAYHLDLDLGFWFLFCYLFRFTDLGSTLEMENSLQQDRRFFPRTMVYIFLT